jgi:hypothetical protein
MMTADRWLADNATEWLKWLDAAYDAAIALGVHLVDAYRIPGAHADTCIAILAVQRA